MKNVIIAMLENRKNYGERLAAFISCQENSPFNVRLYLDHPVDEKEWRDADIVLVTASLLELYGKYTDGRHWIVLDEEGRGIESSAAVIYKYQSAAIVYQKLLAFCADKSEKSVSAGNNSGKMWMMIGIYTPVREEKIYAAILSLCKKMAVNQKVLYLNLEPVTVFREYQGDDDRQEGISELIYYVKQRSKNLGMRIGMYAVKKEFDYLLPASAPAEINELSGEEWQFCLENIRAETQYECVVMDFGASVPPIAVYDLCDQWLLIRREEYWDQCLAEQFRKIICRMSDRDETAKIKDFNLEQIEIWEGIE